MNSIITVGEVKNFLKQGKTIKVKTIGGEFTKIIDYVDKGILNTYKIILENKKEIKVSKDHKFFTNAGWLETKNLIPNKTTILCVDGKYSLIKSVDFIGKHRIVDITVDHLDHCYFGNGMLNHNTGKSLLAAHIIANTQKKGGLGVMIDTENSAAPAFWRSVGVNLKKCPYVQLVTVEEIFSKIEEMIGVVRKSSQDRLATIVVDSLAMASCETEMESAHGKDGYNTSKAIIISKALRKITGLIGRQKILVIFTNQLRMNMNSLVFGDKYVVPGGKAMGFAASVRVRLANIGQIKNKDKMIMGTDCKAIVTKNRVGPPKRIAQFEIHFDSGIQDLKSWIDFLKTNEMITGTSAKWTFKVPSGEYKLSTSEFVEKINQDSNFKDEVYTLICDKQIMKYRDNPDSKIEEEVTIDDTVDVDD